MFTIFGLWTIGSLAGYLSRLRMEIRESLEVHGSYPFVDPMLPSGNIEQWRIAERQQVEARQKRFRERMTFLDREIAACGQLLTLRADFLGRASRTRVRSHFDFNGDTDGSGASCDIL